MELNPKFLMSVSLKAAYLAYLAALIAMPFFPHLLNLAVLRRMNCEVGQECFDQAVPFISEQGIFIGIAIVLLWPLVAALLFNHFRNARKADS